MNQQIEALFNELVGLSPAERDTYFEQHQTSAELRIEVEVLLRFDASSDHKITRSISLVAEKWVHQENDSEICGPYRLIRLLGKGGMGAVYLAGRADGEVRQQVAIKLLHPANDIAAFEQRFLREREILATLHHPGIARLIDAGRTENGRPYLALDYIEGTQIDVYAEGLDLRRKLALFLQVSDAVSYAHRNLIIHRDLKPSNILVDALRQPKLLDFGVAKILDDNLDQTRTQERLLTPEYASPEQIRGGLQTTATDVYSLGAILYKLLTGRSPHSSSSTTREGLLAAICAVEPAPPSSISQTPRDLDYIVAKALRKEPEERYGSVEALEDDVRAFLEFRPVRARSGNTWYRARKFVRRYRVGVGALALVIASASVALYGINRERAVAERRFAQVRQLANRVLALDPVIERLPGSTKARQEILAMSQEYLEALRRDVSVKSELAVEVAEAYLRVGKAQGVPTVANLGQIKEAEASLTKADGLLEAALQASPRNRRALLLSADVAQCRMILANTNRQREEMIAQANKAAQRVEAYLSFGPPERGSAASIEEVSANVALAFKNLHMYPQSVRQAKRTVEIASFLPGQDLAIATALSVMADSLRFSGDLEGALNAIRQAQSYLQKAVFAGETSRRQSTFNIFWREGCILGQAGAVSLERPDEALVAFEKAFDVTAEWARLDPQETQSRTLAADAAVEIGRILENGEARRALATYDHALGLLAGFEPRQLRRARARLLADSSYPLRKLHQPAEARKRIDAAFTLLRELKDYP